MEKTPLFFIKVLSLSIQYVIAKIMTARKFSVGIVNYKYKW